MGLVLNDEYLVFIYIRFEDVQFQINKKGISLLRFFLR